MSHDPSGKDASGNTDSPPELGAALRLEPEQRRALLLAVGALNDAAIVEACAVQVGSIAHHFEWASGADLAFDLAVRARALSEELHAAMGRTFGLNALGEQPAAYPGAPRFWTPGG
ncbi:MAG: hypothetical protein ABIR60_08555 [Allosphingosinicella sp.]